MHKSNKKKWLTLAPSPTLLLLRRTPTVLNGEKRRPILTSEMLEALSLFPSFNFKIIEGSSDFPANGNKTRVAINMWSHWLDWKQCRWQVLTAVSWKIKKNHYFSSAVIQHQLEQKATSTFLLKTSPVKDNIAYTPELQLPPHVQLVYFPFLYHHHFSIFLYFQAFLGTCKSGMSGTCVAISRNCRLCLCAFFWSAPSEYCCTSTNVSDSSLT